MDLEGRCSKGCEVNCPVFQLKGLFRLIDKAEQSALTVSQWP